MVPEDNDARLGSDREHLFIPLHSENAHRGNRARGPFLDQRAILAKGKTFEGAHALNTVLLLIVALQPNLAVRMVAGKSAQ